MRVAVISDIHSNLAALEAVLQDVASQGAREVWCLGDIVGYGPQPRECLRLVRDRAGRCIAGNHDYGSVGAISLEDFNPYAAAASRWTGGVLTPEEKACLGSLPARLDFGDVTLAHGSPREPVWEYVLTPVVAMASFASFPGRLCWVGHSHVPFVCIEPGAEEPCHLCHASEGRAQALGDRRAIVNPGSVGQPRDGDPRASYAVYDADLRTVLHRRVPYDIEATQSLMRRAGLPQPLIDRLQWGR